MTNPIPLAGRRKPQLFDPASPAAVAKVIRAHICDRALKFGENDEYVRVMRSTLPTADVLMHPTAMAEPFSANMAPQVIDFMEPRSSRVSLTPHPAHQPGTENNDSLDRPSPDPAIGRAAEANAEIRREALQFSKQQYEDSKPRLGDLA